MVPGAHYTAIIHAQGESMLLAAGVSGVSGALAAERFAGRVGRHGCHGPDGRRPVLTVVLAGRRARWASLVGGFTALALRVGLVASWDSVCPPPSAPPSDSLRRHSSCRVGTGSPWRCGADRGRPW
ncbi:hypothetical protein ACGF1Z_20280 [Streptomyces sp. NPDC048018]|uniref:hypothetical protein n=1 Tax=Streptomyces sp. NPDC048018 TaxID=3365499 RepID=UPI00372423F9